METCTRSGMPCAYPPLEDVWRVFNTQFEPISDPYRGKHTSIKSASGAWGRFDAANHSVMYTGTTQHASFAEVLAPLRRNLLKLAGDAAAVGLSVSQFLAEIESETNSSVSIVSRQWRAARKLACIQLPIYGRYVRVFEKEVIFALERAIVSDAEFTRAYSVSQVDSLDLGSLMGTNRRLTTLVSGIISVTKLDDGRYPLGIEYKSRFEGSACHVTYLHSPASGTSSHPLLVDVSPINPSNRALIEIASAYGLHIEQ